MQEKYILKYYALVFLDLLNQSEMLEALEKIDVFSPEANKEHIEALKKTIGLVNDFHKAFQFAVSDFLQNIDINVSLVKRYSDSIILYIPLSLLNAEKVESLLDVLCDFMFCTLSAKIPCRGSIAIGKATEIEVNDKEIQIYGPVLSKAVNAEKKAEYPSILVMNDFIEKYINDELKRKYLIFDNGEYRINPISESVKRNKHFKDNFINIKAFIDESIEKFKRVNDEKLVNRYLRLKKSLD